MNPNLNLENPDNLTQDFVSNMSEEEKTSYMLKYVKTLRINSNIDVFDRLLSLGFSPNITSPEGKSLLMIAAEKGLLEPVQLLLDAGAEVEKKDNYGKTALFYATEAATENVDVISVLLDYNAKLNTETLEGKTPLIRAVEKNQCAIAKTLLMKRPDMNSTVYDTGDTALHLAVKQENVSMVKMLLENGADIDRRNRKKLTPADLAQGNSSLMEVMQPYLPKQNVSAQISEFMQIKNQRNQSPDTEKQGKQNEEQIQNQQQDRTQGQGQGQDQDADKVQKQPLQDYRRHQQQQQLNQKKSPQHFQQKVEKEPPVRKYPGKMDAAGLRRTVSSNETYPKESMMSDSNSNKTNENITGLPSSMTSSTNTTNNSAIYSGNTLEVPQNPREMAQNYNITPFQGDDLPNQAMPGYNTRTHDHGKSPENNNQYMYQNRHSQNKKANTIGPTNSNEMSNPATGERFPEQRDMPPSIMKSPSGGDYVNQFHNQQQQQQQMQAAFMGSNPAMTQINFNPGQMKGNVSPSFYGNPQFFAASPNPNNAQPYQKRKPKGQMNTPNTNKNFPMNAPPNPTNPNQGQNPPQNMPQNLPQNIQQNMQQGQYNRGNMEGGRPDQVFQQRGGPNAQANPKFNKGGDRNFQDGNMQQRGFVNPQGYPNMPMPQNVQDMPEVPKMASDTMIKMQGSNREDGGKEQKGGRPQQQQYHHQQQQQQGQPQGNMMFNNNGGMFPPNFMMMQNNMPGQNPIMFNVAYPQNQPGNMNMMNSVGQNMPQNNFMNYNQNMTPQRNQQMMGKGQMMQGPFPYPNGVQMNAGLGDPKVVHLNMNDPITAENMKLTANVQSIYKGITDQLQDIEKMKTENKDLRISLDDIQQNEKLLQDKLREKERFIEELKKKNEDLEQEAKEISSKNCFPNRQDSSVTTDGLLDNFQAAPLDKILQDPKPNVEFWKHDQLANALHEEVAAFEKSVDNFNMEKKNLFESLVGMIRQTVAEVITETEFYIYGSFATGLSLPWSDIDIVVKIPQLYYNGYAALLDSIESNLKKKKWVDDIKVIKNTSVPVLKITCSKSTYTSKKVDISLQDSRHNGLACVELVKDYLNMYPALRPLVLVLKQFLYRLNLNDTYSGGLSSYGLILMVVYLFQTREMQHLMTPVENQNLGSLLLSFLFFYGFEFDYYNQFLVNPKKIPKGNEINDPYTENINLMNLVSQNPPSIMEPKIIIQDPLSSVNNVGRSTFQIKQIKNAFMAAYFEAYKPCICEVHKFVAEIDTVDGKKPVHKCANIIRRMLLALQPLK